MKRRGTLLALIALSAGACGGPAPDPPPPIVLITIDTLRADHLPVYGYFRDTSPTLTALAQEAVVVENALTTMATTLPAHASLLTSTRTTTHGLKGNFSHFGLAFEEDFGLRTAAEMLRDIGYQTAAFVSATPVKDHTGLERGFTVFDQPEEAERRAEATADRAIAWLGSAPETPYFLWVHLFDPHRPRRPPPPYDQTFEADAALISFLEERAVARARDPYVLAQNDGYDGEILYTDAQIGRILAVLESRGDWERSAVVVTSDHGEGLGQHNWMRHGRIYNEQLFVPLIMKFPRETGLAGRRVQRFTSLIDVLPTLADTLQLPLTDADRAQFEGINILADADAESRPGVLSEQVHRSELLSEPGLRYALTNSRWKYFYLTAANDELYDMARDPIETRNLVEEQPEVAGEMKDAILRILADTVRQRSAGSSAPLDEEVVRQLESLGYLGAPGADSSAPVWRGLAIWGHEVRELRPCGWTEPLWVIDDSGQFRSHYLKALAGDEPSTPVYMEVEAHREGPPTEGFGAGYAGSLRVLGIKSVGARGVDCPGS